MAKEKSRLSRAGESPSATAKRWLRRYLIRQRQSIKEPERRRLSRAIVRGIPSSAVYRRAKTVALFIGFGSEVRTEELFRDAWKRGKNVLIPITSLGFDQPFFALFKKGDRLVKTPYGPLELVEQARRFDFRKVDVVFVPGLGFDRDGHRLGYGGGVYDRLLERTPKSKHMGIFFGFQRVQRLPRRPHDRPLAAVATEHGVRAVIDLA